MKLVKVKELPRRNRRATNNNVMELVKQFVDGDDNVCEVKLSENEYKNVYTASKGINVAIKALGMSATVQSCVRNKKVYIFRKEI